MPTVYMMIGVPCSGKSTYVKKNLLLPYTTVLSTDDVIEKLADMAESTYSECFEWAIKFADKVINIKREWAITNIRNVVYDQCNLTVSSRSRKLSQFPKRDYNGYHFTAVFIVPPPLEVLLERNLERAKTGKFLRPELIKSMLEDIAEPNLEEGFDEIIRVEQS
jgi:predicted kinase